MTESQKLIKKFIEKGVNINALSEYTGINRSSLYKVYRNERSNLSVENYMILFNYYSRSRF